MVNLFNVEAMESAKPVLLMIVVQSIYALVNILFKIVINDGTSLSILIAYRFIFSTAFIVPFAVFFEWCISFLLTYFLRSRMKSMHNITGKVIFQVFLCGLFGGSLQQNLYVKSLALVSTTYTVAMLNLIPAITYIMVVSLRMEKPNLGTLAGKAKLLGTIIGICGAMILTLYKGRRLFNWSMHIDLLQHASSSAQGAPAESHVCGLTLALATSFNFSIWFIIQSKMTQNFPWHYSIAALTSIMSAIQSIVYALCTERDRSQWKLDWNLRLLTVASAGILASGTCFTLIAWCVRLKGPLFVSAFNPLTLLMVAFAGSFILNEYITIGSLIGAVLIVCGLYMLLWGKSKETRKVDSEIVSAKGPVKCDSIHISNEKKATSGAPVKSSTLNNTSGKV